MNTLYNCIATKAYPFDTMTDFNDFYNMSDTCRAEAYAQCICNDIKFIDNSHFYYYDMNSNIWVQTKGSDFIIFTFKFFDASAKLITQIFKNTETNQYDDKKKIELIKKFDKQNWIKDICERTILNIMDISIVNKMDNNKYILGLLNGKKINLKTLEVTNRTREDYISNVLYIIWKLN